MMPLFEPQIACVELVMLGLGYIVRLLFLLRIFPLGFYPVGDSFSFLVAKPIRSESHDFDGEVQIELFMVWIDVAC